MSYEEQQEDRRSPGAPGFSEDVGVGASAVSSSSSRAPVAGDVQQQEEWTAAAASLPESFDPTSPPLFAFLGEVYRRHEWVRLKSQGSKDWIAQIIAFVPAAADTAADTAADAAADAAAAASGKIVCRWAWDPADLREECCPDLPQNVYSTYEIVPALNFADLNPVASIKGKITVETLQQWLTRTAFPGTSSSSSSRGKEETVGSDDEGGVSSALFYRHAFDVESGFEPQISADCFRFKRIKTFQQQQQETAAPAPAPAPPTAFRRHSAARNPDMRLFCCIKCCHIFGPPDDAGAPPWGPGPQQKALLQRCLQEKLNSSRGCRSSSEQQIYKLLQQEVLAAETPGNGDLLQSEPIYIESPDCLLFLYKTFPAQKDIQICCWRCAQREKRRQTAKDAAAAAAEPAAAEPAAAAAPGKRQHKEKAPSRAATAGASKKRLPKSAAAAAAAAADHQQQDAAAAATAAASSRRAKHVREENRKAAQQQQQQVDAEELQDSGSEYSCSSSSSSSNSSNSRKDHGSDSEFDVTELRKEYLSLHELDREELNLKEIETAKRRAAAASSSSSSSSRPANAKQPSNSTSSTSSRRSPLDEGGRARGASGSRTASASPTAAAAAAAAAPGVSPRVQRQKKAAVALGPLVRQRDWQQGAARRLQKLEEVFYLGLSELQPTLQLQQEADAAAALAAAAVVAAAAAPGTVGGESSSAEKLLQEAAGMAAAAPAAAEEQQQHQQQQQQDVTVLSVQLKYPSAAAFAAAVHEAFCRAYGGAPQRLRQQHLYELLANLRRKNNQELRRKVLLGDMSLQSLIAADADTLAPAEIRKERREERERHFRRAVILTETVEPQQILKKTHKGLETVRDELLLPQQQQQQQQQKRRKPPVLKHSSSSSSGSSSSDARHSGDDSASDSGSSRSSSSSRSTSSSDEEGYAAPASSSSSSRKSSGVFAAALQATGDAAAAAAENSIDVKKELHALQQLFGSEAAAAAAAAAAADQQQQQQGDEAAEAKERHHVRFAAEVKESSRGSSRRTSSSRKQQQQQQQFELLSFLVPQDFSSRPLSVPPNVAAYTPEDAKQRVLQVLQRVELQQQRLLRQQQQQQDGEEAAAAAHAVAADCSTMRRTFSDLLQCAYLRVSTELARSKGSSP